MGVYSRQIRIFFRTKRKDGGGDPPQMSRGMTAEVVEVGDPPSFQMVARMLRKEL